jgi:hypothetical protein
MSWSGQVTVFSPNGTPIESFHADITSHYPDGKLVDFLLGEDASRPTKHIMETTLPFICEGDETQRLEFRRKDYYKNTYHVTVWAGDGKIVREFDCASAHNIQGLWQFMWRDGDRILGLTTSFPAIVRLIEEKA